MKIIYNTGKNLTKIISALFFRIKVYGSENIPESGGFILASNHISYYDPPLVGSWQKREVFFLAKKELFKNRAVGNILKRCNSLPLNRRGIDREALDLALNVLHQGYGLTIFPEGTRSKSDSFLPPKPGIGMIATQAKCPIVPSYIHGSNNLSQCFKGIDKMRIIYGEPLSADWVLSFPPEKDSYIKISQEVMRKIEELKNSSVIKE